MPTVNFNGTGFFYDESGSGQPVIFIHGVWMSGRFFEKQLTHFGQQHRAIALDLRSHGCSEKTQTGNTVFQYARDLGGFIEALGLSRPVLVGWSMGALVIWEYLRQFGTANVQGTVIVEQSPYEYAAPGWQHGGVDMKILREIMSGLQDNQEGVVRGFFLSMFHRGPTEEESAWMVAEACKPPASIAAAIFFDQTVLDCRGVLPAVNIPTLVCFGAAEPKLVPTAIGEYIVRQMPNARLELFGNSNHCPFLEEANRFNEVVGRFIGSLR
ncbi:MAG TPA: alpha/beta hydrolase [Candidatus Magasanikbacteria bacterium]|nr:MAG: hypothetical protein A3I74_01000 [Candidatus Magasanikbacteria bacterium RIFCSPLOWO2_02_FULL_47_16]OGH79978.1 MAG: hypothetical protein A3C10_02225 [Candidatus Magasanikbacteria bacterium RIFCSPHIGHO2_02_FULL_48_18]OGH82990.1 MAG: hypothetical protein A3G08_03710 [Candidatus Magasanikbacteria bacterium RIFCSPLOWO2_12_FULL_47_9b]HAZ28546.1 alpha/beta hydrolase [Candidatus Magasanikbacteria bacterium]